MGNHRANTGRKNRTVAENADAEIIHDFVGKIHFYIVARFHRAEYILEWNEKATAEEL